MDEQREHLDKSLLKDIKKIRIFTDGSCSNNGGYHENIPVIGSYGFVVVDEEDNILTEYVEVIPGKTNNQMELSAIIAAYSTLHVLDYEECEIFSDSKYAINAVSYGPSAKNQDLVRSLQIYTKNHPKVKLTWVKGHADSKWNNYIDKKIQDASTNKN